MNSVKDDCLALSVFGVPTEEGIQVSLRFNSVEQKASTGSAPLRVVALVDTSGSMLQYTTMSSKRPKIRIARSFCHLLTKAMYTGDSLAVVAFGEQASIVMDMCPTDPSLQDDMIDIVDGAKCQGDSTNLSDGLRVTFRQISQDMTDERCHYVIVIISDGAINSGIVDTKEMKMFLRGHIKKHGGLVSISTVVTSGTASDVMLGISESFGSQPYVYLDGKTKLPEISMVLPVMQQQFATAFGMTVTITSYHGIRIDWKNCTQRYLRHHYTNDYPTSIKMYVHDISEITPRSMGISLITTIDYENLSSDEIILELNVKYFNKLIEKKTMEMTITKRDMEKMGPNAKVAVCLDEIRDTAAKRLTTAAEYIDVEDTDACLRNLKACSKDINRLTTCLYESVDEEDIEGVYSYVSMIDDRLNQLETSVAKSPRGKGHKWNKIMALKTDIDTETLGITETLETLVTKKFFANEEKIGESKGLPPYEVPIVAQRMQSLESGFQDFQDGGVMKRRDSFAIYQTRFVGKIQDVADMLTSLTDTVHQAQTLPRNSTPLSPEVSEGSSDLVRLKTAKKRVRMTQDLERLLDIHGQGDKELQKSLAVAEDETKSWEELLDDMMEIASPKSPSKPEMKPKPPPNISMKMASQKIQSKPQMKPKPPPNIFQSEADTEKQRSIKKNVEQLIKPVYIPKPQMRHTPATRDRKHKSADLHNKKKANHSPTYSTIVLQDSIDEFAGENNYDVTNPIPKPPRNKSVLNYIDVEVIGGNKNSVALKDP